MARKRKKVKQGEEALASISASDTSASVLNVSTWVENISLRSLADKVSTILATIQSNTEFPNDLSLKAIEMYPWVSFQGMKPWITPNLVNDLYSALGGLYIEVRRAQRQQDPNQALLLFANETCHTTTERTESGLLTMTRDSMSRKEKWMNVNHLKLNYKKSH